MHGTTTTTNALLERKIAKVGLITTKGFRDVLELGRRTRPQPYGLRGTFKPLIDREVRLEVPERMDADGKVITPLEGGGGRGAKKYSPWARGLVIHFCTATSIRHEKRAAESGSAWPNGYITAATPSCRSTASTSARDGGGSSTPPPPPSAARARRDLTRLAWNLSKSFAATSW